MWGCGTWSPVLEKNTGHGSPSQASRIPGILEGTTQPTECGRAAAQPQIGVLDVDPPPEHSHTRELIQGFWFGTR